MNKAEKKFRSYAILVIFILLTVLLAISGDGRLLEARIERPSGNAAMDSAVTRLLNDLRTQILPKSPDGRPWRNRVTFDTSG